MKTVCRINQCCGCKACVDACKQNAILIQDNMDTFNAVIDEEKCVSCGKCFRLCPNNMPIPLKKSISWHQGWAKHETIREKSSSGGFAAEIAAAFVKQGGIVCSCAFSDGRFGFHFADKEEELLKFRGSKYVKSDPQGCYDQVKQYLEAEKKVLFIGLPCQTAAVQKYIGEVYRRQLYTVDLICHGTPSVRLLKNYLSEKKHELENMHDIAFRKNNLFGLSEQNHAIEHPWLQDNYIAAFLKGVTYTENCYSCPYATPARGTDLTLGDSWGSELPQDEIEKGISLALCQTEKGEELLASAELELFDVDYDRAVQSNAQLQRATLKPKNRGVFFHCIKCGMSFENAYGVLHLKNYIKRNIKRAILYVRCYKIKSM